MSLLLQGCAGGRIADGKALGYRKSTHEECVPYARRASGIPIYGNAHTWWAQAAGNYQRGAVPAPGAVLVLAKTSRLRNGHLAVVATTLGPREINVTHTNWGNNWANRRIAYESLRVIDASPRNDWTSVRFWNYETRGFGAPYAAHGFIYNIPEYAAPAPVATPAVTPVAAPMAAPVAIPAPTPVITPAPLILPPAQRPRPIL